MSQTYQGLSEITGIIGSIVLVNSVFHCQKDFFENYLHFGARAHKNVRQPFPRPKKFEEFLFERAPNYLLARAAHMPWADPASQSEASVAWCHVWLSNVVS
jgi:hypothetical protein